MVAAGVNPDEAYEQVRDMEDIEPLEGEDAVTDTQLWRMCVDSSTKKAVQLSKLAGQMQAKQYAKVQLAYDFGVTPDDYVRYYEIRADYDKDGKESYSNAEVKVAIDSMCGLTNEDRAVLWQLATGSKSTKNNPYDKQTGQKVIDARNKE